MTEAFHIRRATVDDMATISSMIDEAAIWLMTKGTDQWTNPWPSRVARDARVGRGVASNGTWIVENDGEPIATLTYRRHGNQELWTDRERRDPAVYVSRLIVNRSSAAFGIGAALIDWAGCQALQAWEAQWIRIDVWTTNVALHNYYEAQGFSAVRTRQLDDQNMYPSGALFQKPTAKIDQAAAARFRCQSHSAIDRAHAARGRRGRHR